MSGKKLAKWVVAAEAALAEVQWARYAEAGDFASPAIAYGVAFEDALWVQIDRLDDAEEASFLKLMSFKEDPSVERRLDEGESLWDLSPFAA